MARFSVFLNDELLDQINKEAKREGTHRSALIQTALEKYVEGNQREREEQEKEKKMEDACRKMDALAKKLGNGTLRQRSANFVTLILRAIRDFHPARMGCLLICASEVRNTSREKVPAEFILPITLPFAAIALWILRAIRSTSFVFWPTFVIVIAIVVRQ